MTSFEAADDARRFLGVSRLYGKAASAAYRKAHLCVVGVGGVGSWAAEALARSGVGALTFFDLDMVALSNTNRQIHALEGEFGKAKVEAMKERVLSINPNCRVSTIEDFVTVENAATLLNAGYDGVIDAIDEVRVKAAMIAFCHKHKIPFVTCGAAGGKADPTRIREADLTQTTQDPLLAQVRTDLRRSYGFPSGNSKKPAKFGVCAIYSEEPIQKPQEACDSSARLHCAGYGSTVCVTAPFGLFAAAALLQQIQ